MKLNTLEKKKVKNKKVFLRLDLDVPIENFQIADASRLKAASKTIDFLIKNNNKVIAAGHRGRPEVNSKFRIQNSELSLEPVALWFARLFNSPIERASIGGFDGWKITENFHLLENLRFLKGEKENSKKLSKKLAGLADFYVNDAFAVSHRENASLVGITEFLPSCAGLRLEKETEILSNLLKDPKRPLVAVIGGAKIETKLPLVEKMHDLADFVLVGGEIADQTKILLKMQHEKAEKRSVLIVADLTESGKDISQKSAENFVQIIKKAKTIIWNGPMGLVEEGFDSGTKIVAEGIGASKAYSVVGGGDTGFFLKAMEITSKFSFISVGGGAMLEFLSGNKLPAIEVLKK
ncbi:phosphoglycerate kinase [Patescibacteria group bacterium]|nr:phosphoglycerate kinase [Patescibacteria group bacterium]